MAVKAFLSYSYQDRHLASKTKVELEQYGFDVFLAHEDIQPSLEWQEEIISRLGICDVFVGLLTDAFDESDWAHQEIGIAFSRRHGSTLPIMVPINAGKTPVGFFGRYQAIRLEPSRADEPRPRPVLGSRRVGPSYMEDVALRIARSITSQDPRLWREIRNSLIGSVLSVRSFDHAGWLLWALVQLDGLTPDEINRLLTLASKNEQVYRSGSAWEHLEQLIENHKKDISKAVLEAFHDARGD